MKAINLLDKKEYEVLNINNNLCIHAFGDYYHWLFETYKDINKIDPGFKYSYYMIDHKLYESWGTNLFTLENTKKEKQLTLFDFID